MNKNNRIKTKKKKKIMKIGCSAMTLWKEAVRKSNIIKAFIGCILSKKIKTMKLKYIIKKDFPNKKIFILIY